MARKTANTRESGVRNRLLEAADRLFYTEGVRAVGIDRVLADAEAAKASLYSHFRCKDELVAAYLERRVAAARASIDAFVSTVPPKDRALRMFDWIIEWVEAPEFRGCPMQHVVSEIADATHPARRVAASQREWLFEHFTEWARAAGAPNAKAVAGALVVLFDGAVAASEQDGPQRARDARWAAKALLER
jgi:AcrR family transcriptional regulator